MIAADRYLEGRRYVTARSAATRCGFSRDHVTRLCRAGKILSRQIDGVWYLDEESLENFLLEQDKRKEETAAQLRELRSREYQQQYVHQKPASVKGPKVVPQTR